MLKESPVQYDGTCVGIICYGACWRELDSCSELSMSRFIVDVDQRWHHSTAIGTACQFISCFCLRVYPGSRLAYKVDDCLRRGPEQATGTRLVLLPALFNFSKKNSGWSELQCLGVDIPWNCICAFRVVNRNDEMIGYVTLSRSLLWFSLKKATFQSTFWAQKKTTY